MAFRAILEKNCQQIYAVVFLSENWSARVWRLVRQLTGRAKVHFTSRGADRQKVPTDGGGRRGSKRTIILYGEAAD
jgi:hypothetical protein